MIFVLRIDPLDLMSARTNPHMAFLTYSRSS
nr:unnamed protein product [Digitaria exilis]